MFKNTTFLTLSFIVFWFSACMPYQEEQLTEVNPDSRDSICQQIFTFQDEQNAAALYPYFHHKNPTYRYLSVLAFASIKEEKAIDSLVVLLNDKVDKVGAAAAFSLGQIGSATATEGLVAAFAQSDTSGLNKQTNSAILEAVGKCGDESFLNHLSSITTYQSSDTLLLEGQAWGIYRYALRNIISPSGTQRMLDLLSGDNMPNSVRVIAANYLFRAKNVHLDSLNTIKVANIFKTEQDARIRMALAVAIGKSKTTEAYQALSGVLENEKDYRVVCNIIRSLGNFPYQQSQPLIQPLLKNKNKHIAIRAAQHFVENGVPQDASAYWNWAKEEMPWQTQISLYAAANKHLPTYFVNQRNNINAELRYRFISSENPYEKAACLKALAEFGWNYRYVYREGVALKEKYPILGTTGVESLAAISDAENFRNLFNTSSNYVTRELAASFKEAIETGDAGVAPEIKLAIQIELRRLHGTFKRNSTETTLLNRLARCFARGTKLVGCFVRITHCRR